MWIQCYLLVNCDVSYEIKTALGSTARCNELAHMILSSAELPEIANTLFKKFFGDSGFRCVITKLQVVTEMWRHVRN